MSGFEYEQSNGESNFEIPTIRVHRRQLSGSQILKENARIKSLQLEIYLEQETFPDEEIKLSYRSNQMTNITTAPKCTPQTALQQEFLRIVINHGTL